MGREDAEVAVRKTLCSCFHAVDGTITLRLDRAADAARAVAARLRALGLLGSGMDVPEIEQLICGFVGRRSHVPLSVPARLVASRICDAIPSRA